MPSPERIQEVFGDALEVAAEGRGRFVEEACGGDAALRGAVEELLAAHARAGAFMVDPTVPPEQILLPDDLPPETRVGQYRIVKRIGEGGYGAVYLAEQGKPLRREVALKVVKPGMDTRQVILRFERERQALALMNHPNIARVFDAGATALGRPYFVMEYVDGRPITEVCDELELDERGRLDLFVGVCAAVQHAHERGVVHRDLKPGNVLVSVQGGVPTPKVIDFGIAKVLQGTAGDVELVTTEPAVLGTLAYMAPEQADWQRRPGVDARTDVYALGVMLGELVPGRTVRGDLDRIVSKATEGDPALRYATADGLARDVANYLADRPVEAAGPGAGYRARKFLTRHRTSLRIALVSSAVALVLGAMAGTAVWNEMWKGKGPMAGTRKVAAVVPATVPVMEGLAPGVIGEYFNDHSFRTPVLTRVDGTVNFLWTRKVLPVPEVTNHSYGVRWTGVLVVPKDGVGGVGMRADDGVRVWLDEELVIQFDSPGVRMFASNLAAGPHPLVIEYWNDQSLAQAELLWLAHGKGAGGDVIPAGALFHATTRP